MIKKFAITITLLSLTSVRATETSLYDAMSDSLYNLLIRALGKEEGIQKHYDTYLETEFKAGIDLAKDSVYDPICKILCTQINGGKFLTTGVLIHHTKDPTKMCILTVAHGVKRKNATYEVIFDKDNVARQLICSPVYLETRDDGRYGIDLALLFLADYPEIEPAKRFYKDVEEGEKKFYHTAGYGNFYYPLENESLGLILYNFKFKHVVSGMYKREKHQTFVDSVYGVDEDGKKKFQTHCGQSFFQSKHINVSTLEHPVTQQIFPCAPPEPGFSGSPLLNENNEIAAVNSSISKKSIKNYHPYSNIYPLLGSLYLAYYTISQYTDGYILGERSHYTTNTLCGGLLASFIYRIWHTQKKISRCENLLSMTLIMTNKTHSKSKDRMRGKSYKKKIHVPIRANIWNFFTFQSLCKPYLPSFTFLALWKATNVFGGILSHCPLTRAITAVKDDANYSQSVAIAPWNKKIDDIMMNGYVPDTDEKDKLPEMQGIHRI